MGFTRQGSPEPIEPCQFILDDAQNVICVCGAKIGRVSHGVIETLDGDLFMNVKGMQCPNCKRELTAEGVKDSKGGA